MTSAATPAAPTTPAAQPMVSIVLRPRTLLEAMDLGAMMLRAHARTVWLTWFGFTLPFVVALWVTFWVMGAFLTLPWLGLATLWVFRPLMDPPVLSILSHAAFGRVPSVGEVLRADLRLPLSWRFYAVSWGRLYVLRGIRLPVDMLENTDRRPGIWGWLGFRRSRASYQQRRARWRALSSRLFNASLGLSVLCLLFEVSLAFNLLAFLVWLLPNIEMKQSLHVIRDLATKEWAAIAFIMAYAAMSLIEPLYVAASFALYLNRRTEIEAWDIGLAFQRLNQRLSHRMNQQVGRILPLAALLLASAILLPLASGISYAQPVPVQAQAPAQANSDADPDEAPFAAAIARAYRDPRFGHPQSVQQWVPRDTPHNTSHDTSSDSRPLPWWERALAYLAPRLINIILWTLLGVALLMLLIFAWKHLRARLPARDDSHKPADAPAKVATRLTTAPLPDDLATAVRALWAANRRREALAMLYRGSVQRGAALLGISPPLDATEADWLRLARRMDDATRANSLATIIRAWQLAAYADRYPDDHALTTLLAGWPAQTEAP